MRFLLIASFPESIINFRSLLIKALLAAGLEVHVVCPGLKGGNKVRQKLEDMGVIAHDVMLERTRMNPISDIRTMFQLWKLMIVIKPNFTLSYTVKPVIYGGVAAWLSKVPKRYSLITGLGYTFQAEGSGGAGGFLKLLVRHLYKFSLRRSHLVFFQNPDDERAFRTLNLLNEKIASQVVNGSGVDTSFFSVAVLPGVPCFLLIARLLRDKGVREYYEAARIVKARHPEVAFKLAGWIDDNPNAVKEEELNRWVASGIIDYVGKLDDVRPAIESCSVYVLPSYREGTPRTVLEAMAMGRAIITTDAPGCRETVIEGENGFLVPVQSVDELVTAMEKFIADPDLVARMGWKSREMAVKKYDVHKVNDVMLKEMEIP